MNSDGTIAAPLLYRRITVPAACLVETATRGGRVRYGGDIRIGDITGDGRADMLVYRCEPRSGLKPCFVAAFTVDGDLLWKHGEGGVQPLRPGPIAIHDINGDGRAEVVCLFHRSAGDVSPQSMADAVIQIRDGRDGRVLKEAAPPEIRERRGQGANWCHQRILIANLRGLALPRDIVIKLGDTLLAFDDELNVLWSYRIRWHEYGACSAYTPAVGDLNGDGRDEINGGYYLLDADGRPLWEKQLAPHMDSVAIARWDHGRKRAICSGGGHVLDQVGNAILALGEDVVPHGQEVRVGWFLRDEPAPQLAIRYNGHSQEVMIVTNDGRVARRLTLNASPNATGMETVHWHGADQPALLYNGGMLFDADTGAAVALPGLPTPVGPPGMGWYHCIPADVCGDVREEVVVYNPWTDVVRVYTPAPLDDSAFTAYEARPRQYNVRLMD